MGRNEQRKGGEIHEIKYLNCKEVLTLSAGVVLAVALYLEWDRPRTPH